MAIAVLLDFSGITRQQYDAVIADMDLGGKPAPEGIFHVAGPTDEGWRVVDVWESQQAFEDFAQNKIMPLATKHGLTAPPRIQVWPVHNLLR